MAQEHWRPLARLGYVHSNAVCLDCRVLCLCHGLSLDAGRLSCASQHSYGPYIRALTLNHDNFTEASNAYVEGSVACSSVRSYLGPARLQRPHKRVAGYKTD